MSLSNYSKSKAMSLIEEGYRQADPSINVKTGSAIRSTVIVPMSLIYASLVQEIEVLRNLHLGNAANISETDMNRLAGLVSRPEGSRSTTTLRVYLRELTSLSLETYPYFESSTGMQFRPVAAKTYSVYDILDDAGELYINVPVISTDFGPDSMAAAETITRFSNLPPTVTRCTNVSETQGGAPTMDNESFLEYLRQTVNDLSIGQIGGIRQYVVDNYPEALNALVVPAGDPKMIRDEVWSVDGNYPNLDRIGSPFAAHEAIGVLDFDSEFGRAVALTHTFKESDVGRRISIDGDIENFRTILRLPTPTSAVISGPALWGSRTATLYGDAPNIGCMADVYLYFPALHIKTAVVDKRFYLAALQPEAVGATRIYYAVAPGFGYTSVPTSGQIVIREGTEDEERATINAAGSDGIGAFLDIAPPLTLPLAAEDAISLYDMEYLEIGTDLVDRPVLYVLQVDRLDPLSGEVAETIPRSEPGPYGGVGWYVGETDPAEVFSTREKKKIFLDTKPNIPAHQPLDLQAAITDTTDLNEGSAPPITSGTNRVSAIFDWSFAEGREIKLITPNAFLEDGTDWDSSNRSVLSGAGGTILEIDGLDVQYPTKLGYRDDAYITVLNSTGGTLMTCLPGEVMVYGDKMELKSGTWHADSHEVSMRLPLFYTNADATNSPGGTDTLGWIADDTDFFPQDRGLAPKLGIFAPGGSWSDITSSVDVRACIYGEEFETVILSTNNTSYIDTLYTDGLPAIAGASGIVYSPVQITAEQAVTNLNASPVRVMYATHSDFSGFQRTLDSGLVQSACKDTLARSFLPSLIDATVRFKGSSSSQEVYDRFVTLLGEASSEVDQGNRVRLDISNIVAALDEEGLSDYMDVNFEMRVTSFLQDGESVVQYINPSAHTKQAMAIVGPLSPGANVVNLRRISGQAPPPGRGKLFLGGNNPAAQELLPYEAVVDNQDNTFSFILRGSKITAMPHADWESAIVSTRDYDPELEFKDGAIYIPAINRPYVRHLVVIKQ